MNKSVISFTVKLPPVSKKNSQQIRWRYTGRLEKKPFIAPSEAYTNYEKAALWQIPKLRSIRPINYPVNVKCLFYMPTRRICDLPNMLNAIDDVMVKAGLLEDDNYKIIAGHDGSRILYDKNNPRTEVIITKMEDG